MIREWVNECLAKARLAEQDLIEYCDLTPEEAKLVITDGNYTVDVAERVLSRLCVFAPHRGTAVPDIPHVELDHGMVLFRKDNGDQCRILTVSASNRTQVEKLSPNCIKISIA